MILNNMLNLGKSENLNSLEQVKKIYLEPVSFVGRCFTDTMKVNNYFYSYFF